MDVATGRHRGETGQAVEVGQVEVVDDVEVAPHRHRPGPSLQLESLGDSAARDRAESLSHCLSSGNLGRPARGGRSSKA